MKLNRWVRVLPLFVFLVGINFQLKAGVFDYITNMFSTKLVKEDLTDQWGRELFDPFENIMGVSEAEYRILAKGFDFNQYAHTHCTSVLPYSGEFSIYKGDEQPTGIIPMVIRPFVFNVIEGTENPDNQWFREKLDTPALQAAPENVGAVFQVASNFDCLEGGGGQKSLIMDYITPGMYVQGEAASISAIAGTIDRMYFQLPVNLIEDFTKKWNFNYSSGYIGTVPNIDGQFGNLTEQELVKASQDVNVGIQKNVCVTGGFGPTRQELRSCPQDHYLAVKIKPEDAQRVTQVFTAALNPYSNNPRTTGFKGLAKIFLHAAYGKTVKYSLVNSDKLFLTLVGGGVFQNKLEWIAQAIDHACRNTFVSGTKKPLEINLVVYNSAGYNDRKDWDTAETMLEKLVKDSGGTWTSYSSK
jgi:hypothetical protein